MKANAILPNSVVAECDSTNRLAKELSDQGHPHGTWISAVKQTQGRGRRGNTWESSSGNLYLSIILDLHQPRLITWVPLCIAISVYDVLVARFKSLPLKIKWPNDLWIGEKKVGGILCEGTLVSKGAGRSSGSEASRIVAGIGLNCTSAPELLRKLATDLSTETHEPVHADLFREPLVHSILDGIEKLTQEGGVSKLVAGYERAAFFTTGTLIQWNSPGTPSAPRMEQSMGRVRGLGPSGELLVETSEGVVKLFSEEISAVRRSDSNGV